MSVEVDTQVDVSTASSSPDGTQDHVSLILRGNCIAEEGDGNLVAGLMLTPTGARELAIALMEKADYIDGLDGITVDTDAE